MRIEQIPIPTMGTGRWYALARVEGKYQQLKSWALVRGEIKAYDQAGWDMFTFFIEEAEVCKKLPEATKEEHEAMYRELAEKEAEEIMEAEKEVEKMLASC